MGTTTFHLIGYAIVAVMWVVAIFGLREIARNLRPYLAPHVSAIFNAVREDWAVRENWAGRDSQQAAARPSAPARPTRKPAPLTRPVMVARRPRIQGRVTAGRNVKFVPRPQDLLPA